MPTYEYACKFCGHQLEIYQPITAEALRRCPACHKLGLKRLISGGAGIIFKGSGFYETDYKQSASAKTASAKAESAKAETASTDKKTADAKTETKPASKPEPVKTTAGKTAKK
jgi:putative FmdB family regulatory protein